MTKPTFYMLEDFVSRDFGTDFLIDKILAARGIHLVYGKRGCGKSQFANTVSEALVNGEPLFERFPSKRSRVLYMSVDMPKPMLQQRILPLYESLDDRENFAMAVRDGPVNLNTCHPSDDWVLQVNDFGPDLIIVDTLHKVHKLDENESATVSTIYKKLKDLFGQKTAFLLIHHEGKFHQHVKGRPLDDRSRGSSAWMDDADIGIHLKKFENPMTGTTVQVSFSRVRFVSEDELMPITCDMETDRFMLRPRPEDEKGKREQAEELLARYPEMEKADFVAALEHEGITSRRHAYRLWKTIRE